MILLGIHYWESLEFAVFFYWFQLIVPNWLHLAGLFSPQAQAPNSQLGNATSYCIAAIKSCCASIRTISDSLFLDAIAAFREKKGFL